MECFLSYDLCTMKIRRLLLICTSFTGLAFGQTQTDTLASNEEQKIAEDPTQFVSRIEVMNEYQHLTNGINLNITTLRSVIKIGRRFTTRIEIPFVYNSNSGTDHKQQGLSDISFRLLGFKIYQSKKDAISLSLEASLNTAQSPLLGSGKNILVFMGTYTRVLIPKRMLLAGAFQQANSVSGDAGRSDISYSKVQAFLLNLWSKKIWTVLSPECFIDYIKGGVSMNMEGRLAFAPAPKVNIWIKGGLGLFGSFIARYQWTTELGGRVFF
jgi:hypothetical protein